MTDILTGRERILTHGVGPQAGAPLDVVQVRDAAGYSKQVPAPPREATFPGIIRLAGSSYVVNTTGLVDGNHITGLAATDGLEGAAVAGDGIPPNTTVASVDVPAVPGQRGSVVLSNSPPFAPATNVQQPIAFTITVQQDAIIGLPVTDDLVGARVSGGGLPDGVIVKKVTVSAVAATNTRPGSPGEVLLTLPPKPVVAARPQDIDPVTGQPRAVQTGHLVPDNRPMLSGAPSEPAPKPLAPAVQPPAPAPTAPADIKFAIPSQMIVIPDNVSRLQLSPVDPLPELIVMLPVNPVDGQMAFVYSTLEIGELTILANVGQTLNRSPRPTKGTKATVAPSKQATGAPTPVPQPAAPEKPPFLKLAPDTGVGYLYSAPDQTWDRID
jgi:hypothetical protein